MNAIDKNIFDTYTSVETALLNDLATEAKTKGKKARTLKGESYYVRYDGVEYDITAEQCRMYKLIRNNYNMFVEHLNSAKSDMLGVWRNVWGEKLPDLIAKMEKGLEICQKYFDAFKSFITEKEEVEVESVVVEEKEETVASEKKEETIADEKNNETSETVAPETTKSEDVDVDALIERLRYKGVISDEDRIIVNEDEMGIDVDVYENGRWRTNIVLYEYD